MAGRTSSGAPTQETRKKHGMKNGKFPVWDHKSAMSALKLRGKGKGVSPGAVIVKVRAWAKAHNDKSVLAACERASKSK